MGANTARVVVGRLLEVRVVEGYRTPADVDMLFDQIDREIKKLPRGERHVTIADWRRCAVMSPDAAQRIAQKMASVNATTERSAALAHADSPVAVMQFLRVIRDAKLPDRKLFFSALDLSQWLGEALSAPERQRLDSFLKEAPETM